MVELHYEEEQVDAASGEMVVVHWRIVVNDEAAALAQAAQDVAEGRSPIAIVEAGSAEWDYAQAYEPRAWTTVVPRAALRKRAEKMGLQVGG